MIDLGHNLGLEVVAEGVEDRGRCCPAPDSAATGPRASTSARRSRHRFLEWLDARCADVAQRPEVASATPLARRE